ncbi:ketopantoate reductase family protein [Siccirubricoccus sp. G192]|uniref:ketopantoate reductase family protein n=1 Tax=Siccirubricoccus sp. G192 TaxID=2849651 RepID=UPI001C2C650C|nr:ketopantoate reductase family protein [Siccirubricoccus sp. G192]MBV1796590.1 ketopantoate reductase family protein [Siccirubricoccus sp. G192]
MRILILGAGAIGGYYGMQLAEAGADVSFLVRRRRAAQIAQDGLVVQSRGRTLRRAVPTALAGQTTGPFDLILLTCKAYDLPQAIEAIAPATGAASLVLPLLNGMAQYEALDARFGADHVLGGLCYIASTLGPDGIIRHTSPGDAIQFGDRAGRPSAQAEALAALFARTPVEARVSDGIVQGLWEKWCMIAASAALTCLLRGSIGEIMATEDGEAIAEAMMAECRAIATGLGHAPRPDSVERTRRQLTDRQSRWAASMMRDIEQGAPRLEAGHIIGDLIRRGHEAGIAAPLLRAAHAQLQIYNAQGAARLAQPRPDAA